MLGVLKVRSCSLIEGRMNFKKSIFTFLLILLTETGGAPKGSPISGGDTILSDGVPGITSPLEIAGVVTGSILGFLVLCKLIRDIYLIWTKDDSPEEESPELKEELNDKETN